MQVHYNIDQLPSFKNAVVTIGTFDGVHKGHQKIIDALIDEAKRVDGETVLITFDPHPRKVVDPSSSLQLINTLPEKISLLEKRNIDHLVVVPFTEDFASQPAEAYIENFLVGKFKPHSIIIGYDHHFGKDRKGNYKLLEEQQQKWNYKLIEIPKHVLDEIAVSSTKIRKSILTSEITIANKLLGYQFFFEGKVVEGDKLGRQLGFPTANLMYTNDDKIHLGEGVYACYAKLNGLIKKGMLSIGKRPTLNDTTEKVEVNIFDFNENIYDSFINVFVVKCLREQIKYNSLEELKDQLHKDKQASLEILTNSEASSQAFL